MKCCFKLNKAKLVVRAGSRLPFPHFSNELKFLTVALFVVAVSVADDKAP